MVRDGVRRRLPPHRHRADVRERGGRRARRSRTPGCPATRSSSPRSSATTATATTQRSRALDEQPRPAGPGLRRPVPDPLAAAARGPLRRDVAGAREARSRGQGPLDRRLQLHRRAPGAARRRRPTPCPPSTRSSCTRASSSASCATTTREHGIATEAWSPIGAGRRPAAGPARSRARREVRQDAGAGRAALAHPAGQHRLPQVDDSPSGCGRTSTSSTSSCPTTTWRPSPRWTTGEPHGPEPEHLRLIPTRASRYKWRASRHKWTRELTDLRVNDS